MIKLLCAILSTVKYIRYAVTFSWKQILRGIIEFLFLTIRLFGLRDAERHFEGFGDSVGGR